MPERSALIVGPSWVGDMVMAQTLFKLLKRQQPETSIDVLAPLWSAPLLARMPEVRGAITLPFAHGQLGWRSRRDLGRQLQAKAYQQALVLPNSWKSALIPFWAKIPQRTGWLGEWRWGLLNDVRRLSKADHPLMIERFMALALPKGATLPNPTDYPRPQLTVQPETVMATLRAQGLTIDSPVLALCPGAEFGPAKRWPESHYAQLAQHYLAQDWQVWVFGSKNDQGVAANIQRLIAQAGVDLTGKTTLGEAIDLLSVVTAVVSNDSGLMHIAAALDRPLVVPYGSSSPKFTPPLGTAVRTLSLNLPCSPCFQRQCPLPEAQNLQCLRDLSIDRVVQALDELLTDNPWATTIHG